LDKEWVDMIKKILTAGFFSILFLWPTEVYAQPTTPTVFLNEKFTLVELARSERAILRYDLRPIRGKHLKIKAFHHEQTLEDTPVREWLFHGEASSERISFEGLPLDVYTLLCYASNEQGEPLAYAAPYIHVEYGGWRAWEKFQPPVETVTTKPPAFEEVEAATDIRNRDIGIGVAPSAVVIRPGQTATLKIVFRNMEAENVEWKLVGEGDLTAVEEGLYQYTAPADQLGTKLYRVEVQSVAHPDLKGAATILVSPSDPD